MNVYFTILPIIALWLGIRIPMLIRDSKGKGGKRIHRTACIIYYHGKIYVPSTIESKPGTHIFAKPVYTIDVDLADLKTVVEKVLFAPRARVPNVAGEEWLKRTDPLLMITGAKSWEELARQGSLYNIGWTEKQKQLNISHVDEQGRWQFNPAKVQIFPVGTPLEIIINIILEDIRCSMKKRGMKSDQNECQLFATLRYPRRQDAPCSSVLCNGIGSEELLLDYLHLQWR